MLSTKWLKGLLLCASALSLPLAACQREEPAAPKVESPDERPPSLAGNAKEYGLTLKQISLKTAGDGFDVRFEISSASKGIVNVRAADSASGEEAALVVETFRRGKWQRETMATGDPKRTVEVWPGGTQYGRAKLPSGERWARVVVIARGLVGKDGAPVPGDVDVTSDAIELPKDQ